MAQRHGVQRMRAAMGLSIDDFAERMGVAGRTIYRWETGESEPSPLALIRLKHIYGEHTREHGTTAATAAANGPARADGPRRIALTPHTIDTSSSPDTPTDTDVEADAIP